MKYNLILFFLGVLFLSDAAAQSQEKPFVDTTSTFEHFVGLQANQLIRQVFNFGDAEDVTNPYLVKYTFKHRKTGLALNVGAGVDVRTTETNEGLKTESESYDVRVGPGWQTNLGKRFEIGVGADVIWGRSYSETSSTNTVVFENALDSTITTNRNQITYFGGGLQFSLNYKLSPHVMIGTEASIYSFSTEELSNDQIDNFATIDLDPETRTIRTIENENSSTDGEDIQLNLPIAIYLLIRF